MSQYRIVVDEMLCQGHGVCTEECPEIFSVEDTGSGYPKVRLSTDRPPEDLLDKVRDAVTFCPNLTLKLVEVD